MSKPNKRKWLLIRENFVFQVKLMLDAVRDLLLSPVAVICTVLDLIKGNHAGKGYFQRLMNMGHQSDHWLNLFGDLPDASDAEKLNASANEHSDINDKVSNNADAKVDNLFLKVEKVLLEQQQNGELTAAAKQKLEYYFEKLKSRNNTISASDTSQPEITIESRKNQTQ